MNISGIRPKPGFYESWQLGQEKEDKMKEQSKRFDPDELAANRKKEMDEIMAKLSDGVTACANSDEFRRLLDTMARFPRYSLNNNLLIMMQKPDATLCQSFTGWREMNRFVKKGEKGIRILAPAPYKKNVEKDVVDAAGRPVMDGDGNPVKESTEVKMMAFKPVSTFDISQTDGEPLPTVGVDELVGNIEGYPTLFEAIKAVTPVPVEFEDITTGAKGYYNKTENRIAINDGMSEVQNVKTLLHEAAHQKLHSVEALQMREGKPSRADKEVEAESVAYVVCQHFGINTSDYSFAYVAGWAEGKDMSQLKESLDTIRKAAGEMITAIDEKVLEIVGEKDSVLGKLEKSKEAVATQPISITSSKNLDQAI